MGMPAGRLPEFMIDRIGVGSENVKIKGGGVSLLDELTVEARFYRSMHELTILAWRKGLTVEALLMLAELVEPLTDPADEPGELRGPGEPRGPGELRGPGEPRGPGGDGPSVGRGADRDQRLGDAEEPFDPDPRPGKVVPHLGAVDKLGPEHLA
jgi:hypothetical protein